MSTLRYTSSCPLFKSREKRITAYKIITEPNIIFWVFGMSGSILPQNMSISPREQKQINAVIPKMSKNRLLSDFCLLSLYNIY